MSTNNQLHIIKKGKKFQVHENFCVDNEFKPSKRSYIGEGKTLEEAIKIANDYMMENIVEY
jgi:hypothetical protein